MLTEAKAYL